MAGLRGQKTGLWPRFFRILFGAKLSERAGQFSMWNGFTILPSRTAWVSTTLVRKLFLVRHAEQFTRPGARARAADNDAVAATNRNKRLKSGSPNNSYWR